MTADSPNAEIADPTDTDTSAVDTHGDSINDGRQELIDAGAVGELPVVDDVIEAMRDVVDPELGINVVDLGLLYGIHINPDRTVTLDMTLTSAACPLTDVIEHDASIALEGLSAGTVINWVWMPPWGPDKITDDGRDQLRAIGFNV